MKVTKYIIARIEQFPAAFASRAVSILEIIGGCVRAWTTNLVSARYFVKIQLKSELSPNYFLYLRPLVELHAVI